MPTFHRAVILTVFVLATTNARAGVTKWSTVGSACTPSDLAIHSNAYTLFGGDIEHSSSATGLISFYCPVYPPDGVILTELDTLYWDTDGSGPNEFVDVQFIQMSRTTGAIASVATFLSNSVGDPNTRFFQTGMAYTVNNSTNVYYVRIDMSRSNVTQKPVLYSVGLEW